MLPPDGLYEPTVGGRIVTPDLERLLNAPLPLVAGRVDNHMDTVDHTRQLTSLGRAPPTSMMRLASRMLTLDGDTRCFEQTVQTARCESSTIQATFERTGT